MTIYENKGLSFVPQKLWGLINSYTIVFMILLAGWIWLGVIDNWSFIVWFFSLWLVVGVLVYLFMMRRLVARIIETRSDSLYIIWSKYFSIRSTELKNEDVKIEYYKSPHPGRFGSANVYLNLYFYSRTDESVDIELKKSFHKLGEILERIHNEEKIQLGGQELAFIQKYHDQLRFEKTTLGRIIKFATPLILIGILAFIGYTCQNAPQ